AHRNVPWLEEIHFGRGSSWISDPRRKAGGTTQERQATCPSAQRPYPIVKASTIAIRIIHASSHVARRRRATPLILSWSRDMQDGTARPHRGMRQPTAKRPK